VVGDGVCVEVGVGVEVGLGVSVRNRANFPTEPRAGVTPDRTVVEATRDLALASPPTRDTRPVLLAREPEYRRALEPDSTVTDPEPETFTSPLPADPDAAPLFGNNKTLSPELAFDDRGWVRVMSPVVVAIFITADEKSPEREET
jgi:hypothetical protein